MKIAIIGGGNLGTAIAEGLIKSKFCKAADIAITKRNITTLKALSDKGVFVTNNNNEAVKKSDLVLLAVKPFQVAEVIAGLKKDLAAKHVIVSVITGVSLADLNEMVKKKILFSCYA